MKNLDINTQLGQKSLMQENKMLEYIKKAWNVDIIETNKKEDASCDGFLVRNNTIIALFESKCRNLSHIELTNYGSWLITFDKLEKCREISKLLKVPFLGFLYLVKDNIVLFWKISDKNGEYVFEFNHYDSKTQKTVNGGSIVRDNAYLPIEYSEYVQNIKKQKNV